MNRHEAITCIVVLHELTCAILLNVEVGCCLIQEKPEDEKYLQYCQVCKGFKPPRSHHCKQCKRYAQY